MQFMISYCPHCIQVLIDGGILPTLIYEEACYHFVTYGKYLEFTEERYSSPYLSETLQFLETKSFIKKQRGDLTLKIKPLGHEISANTFHFCINRDKHNY